MGKRFLKGGERGRFFVLKKVPKPHPTFLTLKKLQKGLFHDLEETEVREEK